jgi:hypothetical protein
MLALRPALKISTLLAFAAMFNVQADVKLSRLKMKELDVLGNRYGNFVPFLENSLK